MLKILVFATFLTLQNGEAQQEANPGDRGRPPALAPIPDPMDAEAIQTLAEGPHNPEAMLRELELLPKPGLYKLVTRSGPTVDEITEERVVFSTVKLVQGRFLVRVTRAREKESPVEISIWTYDGEQQRYRMWFWTAEGTGEARGKSDQAARSISVESVMLEGDGGGSFTASYTAGDEDGQWFWKGQYSSDKETWAWETKAYRIGEVGDKPPKDDGGWPTLIFVVGILVFVVGIILVTTVGVRWREKKRTLALGEAVKELSLEFLPEGDGVLSQRLAGFPLFNIGRGRKLKNLIVADTPEVTIAIFDYDYVTGHGKSRRNRRQTVFAAQSADLTIPAFHLRPQRMWNAIGGLFGGQDIDFDQHPGFSKEFVLKAENEEQTRAFFDDELLDFFAANLGVCVEAQPESFLFYRRWRRVPPQVPPLRDFLGEGLRAFQTVQDRNLRG